MTSFSVNGVERDLPIQADASMRELFDFIRSELVNETCLVSGIRVDGQEITESDERELDLLPVSEIRSVEVFTSHPREMADDTLQTLIRFTEHLQALSHEVANTLKQGTTDAGFPKLVDGISTFTEALRGVKRILRIGYLPSINVLEVDLASILKDILDYYEKGEIPYVVDLLDQHLVDNLRSWREEALPSLIQSRDS